MLFAIGFTLCILLNIGYIAILFYNQRNGERVNMYLYGLTLLSDFYRFRRTLIRKNKEKFFWSCIALFALGILGASACFFFAFR